MDENDVEWTKPQQKIRLKKSANKTLDTSNLSRSILVPSVPQNAAPKRRKETISLTFRPYNVISMGM
jgi:hypothetical protein